MLDLWLLNPTKAGVGYFSPHDLGHNCFGGSMIWLKSLEDLEKIIENHVWFMIT